MTYKFLSVILFFISVHSQGQLTVQFLDADTNMAIPSTYITVAENGKGVYKLHGRSNDNGYFSLKPIYLASRATYHVQLDVLEYEHIWQELDLKRRDTAVIKVKRNPYFIPESTSLYSKKCDGYMLSHDLEKSPRNLDYLPKEIQLKINEYFIDRVGKKRIDDFTLIDGDVIDFEIEGKEFYIENDEPVYYLCFAYRNLDASIAMYSSNLLLGADGKILKDIEFPITFAENKNFILISLSDIREIAVKDSIYIPESYRKKNIGSFNESEITMGYLKDENTLTWNILNKTYYDNGKCEIVTSIYNAQSGKFMKKDEWIDCTYIND